MLTLAVFGIIIGSIATSFVKPEKASSPRRGAVAMDIKTIRKIESEALDVAKKNETFVKLLGEGYTIKKIKPVIEAEIVKVPINASNSENITQYMLTAKILPPKLVKIVLQKNNESISDLVRIDLKKVVGYEHR